MARMAKEIETVARALRKNRFYPVELVENGAAAAKLVLDMIPVEATVGVGGSATLSQIGVLDQLRKRGTHVFHQGEPAELPINERRRRIMLCDVLISSSNAVTLDGKLVNIDGVGNRVAAMIFGPRGTILVIGVNKIVRTVDEAIDRIKNVIAPYHGMARGSKVPCAKTLRCSDCTAPLRMCSVTVIMEKKPKASEIGIVLVNQDLGLGWDPNWPAERREKIASAYRAALRLA